MKFKTISAAILLAAPFFANATPFTLLAGKNVSLEQGVKVSGDVGAKGNVDAKINSQVLGNVASGGNITLEQSAKINGNATAGGNVTNKIDSKVSGNILNHTVSPTLNSLPAATSFTVGTQAFRLNANGSGQISEGRYGKVNLGMGSTLTLTAGSYYFESLQVSAESNFIFDLAGGDINLYILGNVNIGSNFDVEMLHGGAGDIYTETKGNWEQGAFGEWYGTLFGSGAGSNLHFNQGSVLDGTFMANKNIQLDIGTEVSGMASEASEVPVPGSLPLLAIGLLPLAFVLRRKVR